MTTIYNKAPIGGIDKGVSTIEFTGMTYVSASGKIGKSQSDGVIEFIAKGGVKSHTPAEISRTLNASRIAQIFSMFGKVSDAAAKTVIAVPTAAGGSSQGNLKFSETGVTNIVTEGLLANNGQNQTPGN